VYHFRFSFSKTDHTFFRYPGTYRLKFETMDWRLERLELDRDWTAKSNTIYGRTQQSTHILDEVSTLTSKFEQMSAVDKDNLVWTVAETKDMFQKHRLWPSFIGTNFDQERRASKGRLPVMIWPEQRRSA
jgi:hypothetical protein